MESTPTTLRTLPDGATQAVSQFNRTDHLARIQMAPAAKTPPSGSLLEIVTPDTIYLGELLAVEDSSLVVELNHSLDRVQLAAIHEEWR